MLYWHEDVIKLLIIIFRRAFQDKLFLIINFAKNVYKNNAAKIIKIFLIILDNKKIKCFVKFGKLILKDLKKLKKITIFIYSLLEYFYLPNMKKVTSQLQLLIDY